jgi:hypothetical protein
MVCTACLALNASSFSGCCKNKAGTSLDRAHLPSFVPVTHAPIRWILAEFL